MSKELLLDLDGVVIHRKEYFSEKIARDFGISLDEAKEYFMTKYKEAAVGKDSIKESLPPYLAKWGWTGTVEEFLTYWFENERNVDDRVLAVVKGLKEKGVKVSLASDNEANRARYVMEVLNLKEYFDNAFFSCDLGFTKGDPEFFEKVIEKLQTEPSEIEYWDDDSKNIEVAASTGINGHVYTIFNEFNDGVQKLIK